MSLMLMRTTLAIVILATLAAPSLAAAPDPCGAGPLAVLAGQPPHVEVWTAAQLGAGWMPPACSGWTAPGLRTLTAVSGRFRLAGGMPALLTRFGAVSQLAGVRYWSVSAKKWDRLIMSAQAQDASGRARSDFTPSDLVPGRDLRLSQTDTGAGSVIYRMTLVSLSPTRAVLTIENAATIRYALLPLFSPGELQTLYVLSQEDGDTWRYESLTRTAASASGLTDGHAASGINRAVAMFRHIAGIPTDMEPPAAR